MANGEEGQAAEADSSTSNTKGRGSKQWHGQRTRRKPSTSDARKPSALKRTPGSAGIFTNRMVYAIDKASEKQRQRHNSEEARAEREKREEERQKAREEKRTKRAEERARLAEEEKQRREQEDKLREEREAKKRERRAARKKPADNAEATGAADASEAPPSTKSPTKSRRDSHASSTVSGPSIIRRMTAGESDIDRPLLWVNVEKATEKTNRPLPPRHSRSSRSTQSTPSSKKRHSRKKSDEEEQKPSEEEKLPGKKSPKHSDRSRRGSRRHNMPLSIIAGVFKESYKAALAL